MLNSERGNDSICLVPFLAFEDALAACGVHSFRSFETVATGLVEFIGKCLKLLFDSNGLAVVICDRV